MDDNAMATAPRPGTSFSRPTTGANGGISQNVRPMSNSGRPISGYLRPGTNRMATGSSRGQLTTAMKANRPGSSRPVTSGGRMLRIGTASMAQTGGQFIQADKLNARNTAKKYVAKAVVDYLIYVEGNYRKALDISAEATVLCNYDDWWWKERIAKCYLKLGMIKEAERQLQSSLNSQDMVVTHLELAKVYTRKDQATKTLEIYQKGLETHPFEVHLFTGISRAYESINDPLNSNKLCKVVLNFDNTNVESIATLASYHFYSNQPEIALRFYRRLIQCGVNNAELWNNVGLC
jgi:tetratricopeptide repeat protein 8